MASIEVNKAILTAVRTGKVTIGSKKAIKAAVSGKAKLLILSCNCPKSVKDEASKYSSTSKVLVYNYPASSVELGDACGKPFAVAALAVRQIGDSEILKLVGEKDV